MNSNCQEQHAIARRASEWLEALAEGAGERARGEFAAWLTESPMHVREFLRIAALDRLLDGIDSQHRVVVANRGPIANVASLPVPTVKTARTTKRRGFATMRRWAIAAAVMAMALPALWWGLLPDAAQQITTAVGEQTTVKLDDGSIVHLNTRSRMQVRYSAQEREIRLLAGEALFTVERDPHRPFRVYAGDSLIQAVGTRFNVYFKAADDTRVAVLEGKVRISGSTPVTTDQDSSTDQSADLLVAGEAVRIAGPGRVTDRGNFEAAQAIAWRERRVVFRADTLADIVTEFNRYNTEPQIHIADEALARRRFTGVLDVDRPESLMRLVADERDVQVERSGAVLTIRHTNADQTGQAPDTLRQHDWEGRSRRSTTRTGS